MASKLKDFDIFMKEKTNGATPAFYYLCMPRDDGKVVLYNLTTKETVNNKRERIEKNTDNGTHITNIADILHSLPEKLDNAGEFDKVYKPSETEKQHQSRNDRAISWIHSGGSDLDHIIEMLRGKA